LATILASLIHRRRSRRAVSAGRSSAFSNRRRCASRLSARPFCRSGGSNGCWFWNLSKLDNQHQFNALTSERHLTHCSLFFRAKKRSGAWIEQRARRPRTRIGMTRMRKTPVARNGPLHVYQTVPFVLFAGGDKPNTREKLPSSLWYCCWARLAPQNNAATTSTTLKGREKAIDRAEAFKESERG